MSNSFASDLQKIVHSKKLEKKLFSSKVYPVKVGCNFGKPAAKFSPNSPKIFRQNLKVIIITTASLKRTFFHKNFLMEK